MKPERATARRWALVLVVVAAIVGQEQLSGDGWPIWLVLAICAGWIVLLAGWMVFLGHRAQATATDYDAGFASSSVTVLPSVRQVPQFVEPLKRVRLSFLVGGFLTGRLFVSASGVTFAPNLLTRRVLGVPELRLSWDEIETAEGEPRPGILDNGMLVLRLRNGGRCEFTLNRRARLGPVLAELAVS